MYNRGVAYCYARITASRGTRGACRRLSLTHPAQNSQRRRSSNVAPTRVLWTTIHATKYRADSSTLRHSLRCNVLARSISLNRHSSSHLPYDSSWRERLWRTDADIDVKTTAPRNRY